MYPKWKTACMRKLALWYTTNFTPLTYHDELEPLMISLGFVALPPSPPDNSSAAVNATAWKAYSFSVRNRSPSDKPPPRPTLPYPRIDGLHVYTYTAFIDAVSFYLEKPNICDLFHVRSLPLEKPIDRQMRWSRIREEDDIFIYRSGTLDQALEDIYEIKKNDEIRTCSRKLGGDLIVIWEKGDTISTSPDRMVLLEDIIVTPKKLRR